MYGQHLKLKVSFVDLEINAFGISEGGGENRKFNHDSSIARPMQNSCIAFANNTVRSNGKIFKNSFCIHFYKVRDWGKIFF